MNTDNWKQGDKCKITTCNSGVFHDCEILYIDNMSIVFSSSAASSMPVYIGDVTIEKIKTPAEIERERVINLALDSLGYDPDDFKLCIEGEVKSNLVDNLIKLFKGGLLSNPEKRVKPISINKLWDMACMASSEGPKAAYQEAVKLGYIQGVDNE